MDFPSRRKVTSALLSELAHWLCQKAPEQHIVRLHCPHRFSYEYLFTILRQRFASKIYVTQNQFNFYDGLPDIQADLTCDPSATRIHACYHYTPKGCDEALQCNCNYDPQQYLRLTGQHQPLSGSHTNTVSRLTVKLSAAWWFKRNLCAESSPDCVQVYVSPPESHHNPVMRSFFAAHASPAELMDLIVRLRPSRVIPTVAPHPAAYCGEFNELTEDQLLGNNAGALPYLAKDNLSKLMDIEIEIGLLLDHLNAGLKPVRSLADLWDYMTSCSGQVSLRPTVSDNCSASTLACGKGIMESRILHFEKPAETSVKRANTEVILRSCQTEFEDDSDLEAQSFLSVGTYNKQKIQKLEQNVVIISSDSDDY